MDRALLVELSKWMPARTMAACLLFGSAQAAIVRVPALNYSVSPQLLSMFPYLVTLLAFIGLVGKTTPPQQLSGHRMLKSSTWQKPRRSRILDVSPGALVRLR